MRFKLSPRLGPHMEAKAGRITNPCSRPKTALRIRNDANGLNIIISDGYRNMEDPTVERNAYETGVQ